MFTENIILILCLQKPCEAEQDEELDGETKPKKTQNLVSYFYLISRGIKNSLH